MSDLTRLGLLRDELTEVKAALAERESDLAKARQKAEQARPASKAEPDEGKFTSLSAGLLVRKGEAGPSKLAPEGDEIELRRLGDELAAMRASLANREAALAEARLALEQARERGQQESEAALSKAKTAWKTEESARLAAAQALFEQAVALAPTHAPFHSALGAAYQALGQHAQALACQRRAGCRDCASITTSSASRWSSD